MLPLRGHSRTLAQSSVAHSRSSAAALAPMLSGMTMLISPASQARQIIANHLWTYGEDRLARRAVELTDQEIERLQDIAGYYSGTSDTPSGAGMLFAKAVALAAVEVMEREPRLLARSRRRPLDQSPYKKP